MSLVLRVANATNGLAFPPYDEISMFLSSHGHRMSTGYFRVDAMPHSTSPSGWKNSVHRRHSEKERIP